MAKIKPLNHFKRLGNLEIFPFRNPLSRKEYIQRANECRKAKLYYAYAALLRDFNYHHGDR